MDAVELALAERSCDAVDRIPTHKWPFFSTTLKLDIAAGATTGTLTFEAERDTFFTDLSAAAFDDANAALAGTIDLEYCNIRYIQTTNINEYDYCCSRKPLFLVGVRENKRLRFTVVLAAVAPAGGANIEVTLSGIQGNGCCP